MEYFSCYQYELFEHKDFWKYKIYIPELHNQKTIKESVYSYASKGEARLATIGHISLLENGES